MSFKIPCGGFKLDENSFSLDKDGILSMSKPIRYDFMPDGYPKVSEKEVVLLEETVVEMTEIYEGVYANVNMGLPIESGKTYIMYFDHVAYECKAKTIQGAVAAGNLSAMVGTPTEGSNDKAPFAYVAKSNGEILTITDPDYTGNPNFSVVEKIREVTPMAAEFLPTGAGSMRVNVNLDESDSYVADKTYAEIVEAIRNGILPYCVLNGASVLYLSSSSEGLSDVSTYINTNHVSFTGLENATLRTLRIDEYSVILHEYTITTTTT